MTAVVTSEGVCTSGRWVLPRSALGELPGYDKLDSAWVYEHGGFDSGPFGTFAYGMTVETRRQEAVVLKGLSVTDVEPSAAPIDPVRVDKCQGGGDLVPRHFAIALDELSPTITSTSGDKIEPGDAADRRVTLPYKISSLDPESFQLLVKNETGKYFEWNLSLSWISGGLSGTTAAGVHGGHFRSAPTNVELPTYSYFEDGRLQPRG